MASKTYSFYSTETAYVPEGNDSLVIELGKAHIACLVHDDNRMINAMEWFSVDEEEKKDIGVLIEGVKQTSQLVGRPFIFTTLVFNNRWNIIIPSSKFEVEYLHDTIYAAFGSTIEHICQYDELKTGVGFVNAYRIPCNIIEKVRNLIAIDKVQHSYTRFLANNLVDNSPQANFVQVLLYHNEMVVTILTDGELQYMHAFAYQTADDVVYYLLNLCGHFTLNPKTVPVKLSGFVEEHPDMYNFITRFFKNAQFQTYPLNKLNFETGNYPLYYFTPIFNLVS